MMKMDTVMLVHNDLMHIVPHVIHTNVSHAKELKLKHNILEIMVLAIIVMDILDHSVKLATKTCV